MSDRKEPLTHEHPDDEAAKNRGRRAGSKPNGEVTGSGAGAGLSGNPENYDGDPQRGGGGEGQTRD